MFKVLKRLGVACALLCFASLAHAEFLTANTETIASRPLHQDRAADFDGFTREMERAGDLLRLPGYSVAVVEYGRIIYRLNSGYANLESRLPVADDTLFSLASVTKSFTAVMMMQYEAERKISLDDYLLNYPLNFSTYVPSTIDANTRLKDVLSMTSGDLPEKTFNYNGWRYSFLSAVFAYVAQTNPKDAYRQEITSRILHPLKLNDTIDGYPEEPNGFTNRIAQGYYLEPGPQGVAYKTAPYDAANYYPGPSAGLFSTIDDLAAYSVALDENKLLTYAQYEEMTATRVIAQNRAAPYGLGWMTQSVHGMRLHWVYGEGHVDSALLLRVPERRLTLIMLANSADHSSAARLHDGNVLWSPIATAFLKYFVLPPEQRGTSIDYGGDIETIRQEVWSSNNPLRFDELVSQAACRYYMAGLLHETTERPADLLRLLYKIHPRSYDSGDVALMWLMARFDAPDLRGAAVRLIRSFDVRTDHRPEVLYAIAAYYEMTGDLTKSMEYYKILADRPGFRDEWYKINASLKLGRDYMTLGNRETGRKYIWQSALESRGAGFDAGYMSDLLKELSANEVEAR